jgi:hypothetical protein
LVVLGFATPLLPCQARHEAEHGRKVGMPLLEIIQSYGDDRTDS